MQSWQTLDAVSWDNSSVLMKLVTIATVCNKAKFATTEKGDATSVTMPEAFQVSGLHAF